MNSINLSFIKNADKLADNTQGKKIKMKEERFIAKINKKFETARLHLQNREDYRALWWCNDISLMLFQDHVPDHLKVRFQEPLFEMYSEINAGLEFEINGWLKNGDNYFKEGNLEETLNCYSFAEKLVKEIEGIQYMAYLNDKIKEKIDLVRKRIIAEG